MVARLAWAPIPWREFRIVLVLAPLVAVSAWMYWARQPAEGPLTQASVRILKISHGSSPKGQPPSIRIEVEFADGHREWVLRFHGRPHACQVGDSVTITSVPANVGQPEWALDTGTCG